MREERSGSALVAAVRSAQERRALRRLSRRCLARLRRGAGASSSGSLHTSRAACTVCLRRDTGGDVSRDTSDSNIVAAHPPLTPPSNKPILDRPATSDSYNQRLRLATLPTQRTKPWPSLLLAHAITGA